MSVLLRQDSPFYFGIYLHMKSQNNLWTSAHICMCVFMNTYVSMFAFFFFKDIIQSLKCNYYTWYMSFGYVGTWKVRHHLNPFSNNFRILSASGLSFPQIAAFSVLDRWLTATHCWNKNMKPRIVPSIELYIQIVLWITN